MKRLRSVATIINTLLYVVVSIVIDATFCSLYVYAHLFLVLLLVDCVILGFTSNYTLLTLIRNDIQKSWLAVFVMSSLLICPWHIEQRFNLRHPNDLIEVNLQTFSVIIWIPHGGDIFSACLRLTYKCYDTTTNNDTIINWCYHYCYLFTCAKHPSQSQLCQFVMMCLGWNSLGLYFVMLQNVFSCYFGSIWNSGFILTRTT